MTTVEIPNVGQFDVEIWDEGTGEPLLFLHGYQRHPGAAAFLRRLAEHRRVVAPEFPGYGRSNGFENFTDVLDVTLYHRELIRSLGLDRVDVVGHSLGGMFAAELAAIAPQLVRKLVLVDPFGLWLDDHPSVDPFGAADAVRRATWHGEPPAEEPSNFVPDPDEPHGAVLFAARNLGSAGKFMWPIPDRGLRRRLPVVSAPTLVIHGESDELVPRAYAEEFVRLIPDARLASIAEAGHYPMIERENEFVTIVETFLEA